MPQNIESEGRHPALNTLDGNRNAWGTVATPPDKEHYPHTFLWDGAFVAIVRAHYGDFDQAAIELKEILSGQKENGMIPNMKFGPGRNWDLERRLTFLDRKTSSDYSQPPVLAHAAYHTYLSFQNSGENEQGEEFLNEVYDPLKAYYSYWAKFRTDQDSSLVAVIHPHETGRDSDPTFDFIKRSRLKQPKKDIPIFRGAVDLANSGLDYADSLILGRKLKKVGWDPDATREIFWVKDVMMNTIYAQNLSFMARLAHEMGNDDDYCNFSNLARQVEDGILTEMWSPKTQKFHAINSDMKKFKAVTVSNLFPIILPNIAKEQVEATLNLLEDPDWFNTKYPIPTVPVNSVKHDPSFSEHRLWRGPTWINTNWFIMEGLLSQRDRFVARDPELAQRLNERALTLAIKSSELIRDQGYREFYNPHTGIGMRVNDFAWSTLAHLMEDRISDMEAFSKTPFPSK